MKNKLCWTCKGQGQIKETETIIRFHNTGPVTIQMGSGCPKCLGTGIIGKRK